MRKLLPILLGLIGLLAGGGAGLMLRQLPEEVVLNPCGNTGETVGAEADHGGPQADEGHGEEGEAPVKEYVKLNNQFIVPVVDKGEVNSLVILSVSLEVPTGSTQSVYQVEPKLRDSFLKVLFDHANAGGFNGAFTNSNNMEILRVALNESAAKVLKDMVSDVLITDIVRQDN
ncbi:flagellar basal body-associated FliL family protein [Frigidibacter sp. RF13]|uniref:flagellar basal body-associated FliL family protein n=1 Tax=Frigidibacter sp. RF13 TaxID=2997340 RepID=UPI002270032F|nr:flagellar basal body-associated FliL family protein [Frigidibacter sp. RF13]MCY1128696.1 flagellar basal body-associated FliL family protein [Frigidibacter sp. RF13]